MLDWLTSLLAPIVSPDWGQLIGLLPLGVGGIVALFLVFLVRRALSVPPRRLRPIPAPTAPDGIHMPGPSLAPFFAAFGAACFFLALLFVKVGPQVDTSNHPIANSTTWSIEPVGVVAVVAGVLLLVAALLYWGREATREYDALEPRRALLPSGQAGPPPGVHVPGPSFRPLIVSLAFAVLLMGLALGPAIAAGGLVMLIVALVGWLRDAGLEYHETVRADATGHLQNIPAPRFPTGTLAIFGVIFAFTVLVATGLIPPKGSPSASGGAASSAKPAAAAASSVPAASSAPAASGASGAGSTGATGASGPAAVTLELTAQGVQYDQTELTAPADKPFAIMFTNNDAGIPHNVSIHKDSATGAEVFKGEIFTGTGSRTYNLPALPAGAYAFVCTVHANMTGTLTVK